MKDKTKNKRIFTRIGLGSLFVTGGLSLFGIARAGFWEELLRYTYLLFGFIMVLILEIEVFFYIQAGKLFNWVYHGAPDITGDPVVIAGWGITRDVLNMFFVISLLVIAFATILRIEAYQYKALLPKLIYAAVLVNFSKTIASVFIDFSNVLMKTFLNFNEYTYSETFSMALFQKMPSQIPGAAWGSWENETKLDVITNAIIALMATVVVVTMVMIALYLLSAVIIMRNVVLMILVILSPAAFVLNILPATQQYAKRWWDEFLKYVFYGPVAGFLVYLSAMVAYNITRNSKGGLLQEVGVKGELRDVKSLLTTEGFYQMAVMIAILYLAILMVQAISPMAAGAAMGLAKRGYGLAGKAAWGLTKMGVGFAHRQAMHAGEGRWAKGLGSLTDKTIGRLGKPGNLAARGVRGFGRGAAKFTRGVAKTALIPSGVGQRWTRMKEEEMAVPSGEMQDLVNRVIGGEKTNFAHRALMGLVNQKIQDTKTESSPAIVAGYLGATTQAEKMNWVMQAAMTNNLNDLLSHPEVKGKLASEFKNLKDEHGNPLPIPEDEDGFYHPEILKAFFQKELGDSDETCQFLANVQEVMIEKGIPSAMMVTHDGKKWGYMDALESKMSQLDKSAKIDGRNKVRNLHGDAIAMERNGIHYGIHDRGWTELGHMPRTAIARANEFREDFKKAMKAVIPLAHDLEGKEIKGKRNFHHIKLRAKQNLDASIGKSEINQLRKLLQDAKDKGNQKMIDFYGGEIQSLESNMITQYALACATEKESLGTVTTVSGRDRTAEINREEDFYRIAKEELGL